MHFRTRSGVDGIMQSTVGAWGPPVFCTRVAGSHGTVWAEFDTVRVADASGTREIPAPDDLPLVASRSAARDLLVTAYDSLHVFGIDMAPYTRLCTTFRDLIEGRPCPTIRRRQPSPTASPACRCSTRSAGRPASSLDRTVRLAGPTDPRLRRFAADLGG